MKDAADCLNAAGATIRSHVADYGPQRFCFQRIAALWTAMGLNCDGAPVAPQDVAMAMILLKMARQQHASKDDNWVDIAGYAACGAEIDVD